MNTTMETEMAMEEELLMMRWMSEPELDAAYILIQLSGGDYSQYSCDIIADGRSSKAKSTSFEDEEEDHHWMAMPKAADAIESVGDCTTTTSSNTTSAAAAAADDEDDRKIDREYDRLLYSSSDPVMMKREDSDDEKVLVDGCGEIEAYPLRKKRKFRSIEDLYVKSGPGLKIKINLGRRQRFDHH